MDDDAIRRRHHRPYHRHCHDDYDYGGDVAVAANVLIANLRGATVGREEVPSPVTAVTAVTAVTPGGASTTMPTSPWEMGRRRKRPLPLTSSRFFRGTSGGDDDYDPDPIAAGRMAVATNDYGGWETRSASYPSGVRGHASRASFRAYTPEEDGAIARAVLAGPSKYSDWSTLARVINELADPSPLPKRTGKQIRDRWVNYLNPSLNHEPWSREEDARLWKAHAELGNQWTVIGVERFHTTRSENQIKNRWNSAAFRKFALERYGRDPSIIMGRVESSIAVVAGGGEERETTWGTRTVVRVVEKSQQDEEDRGGES